MANERKDEQVDAAGRAGKLKSYRYRRNLLFVSTLVTLALVFLGAVPWQERLAADALSFTVFWALVFVLATFVLGLALFDLVRVRRDHQRRLRALDQEFAAAEAEARELARQIRLEEEGDDGER